MTKILGLSGCKQSGKNTAFNFLLGIDMIKLAIVREQIAITSDGKLWVSDIFGDQEFEGIFDLDFDTDTMRSFKNEAIYPFIRNYSFADCLKEDVCINLLGLSREQCYGTDEQKNQPTHLKWENMPGYINEFEASTILCEACGDGSNPESIIKEGWNAFIGKPGLMTGREVMQFIGTEIFRKMYGPVWAEGTIKRIRQHNSNFAVITDCRFPNEIQAIKDAGGKVIRLTRKQNSEDKHESETSLNPDKFDWNNFDAIIDNENMSITEQNETLNNILYKWGWRDPLNVQETEKVK